MISNKQLAANRLNAQKSTGPKTEEGKAVSRLNSLRHGLLAQDVVLPGENESAFDALYEQLREEFSPQGELEFCLVERIATSCWRLRRIGKVEVGIFEMQRSEADLQRAKSVERLSFDSDNLFGSQKARNAARDEKSYQESLLRAEEVENSQQGDALTIGLAFIKDSREINAFSKLSRYEVAIERSLYRAIYELQRLQDRRQGGNESASVVIDVTGDQE